MIKITCLFLFLFNFSYAQDSLEINYICKKLNIPYEKVVFEFLDYKSVPNEKNNLYVFITTKTEIYKDEEGAWSGDIHFLKFDTKTKSVLAYQKLENTIGSDACRLDYVFIDTPKYIIKPNKRAVAISVRYNCGGRVNQYDFNDYYILEQAKNSYSYVLKTHTFQDWGRGGMDCSDFMRETHSSTYSIDNKSLHNGYYDIVEKKSISTYQLDTSCNEINHKVRKINNRFVFKNGAYICPNKKE